MSALWRARFAELHPRRFFLDTWRTMDAEAAQERQARKDAGLGWDWRPLFALCAGTAFLTFMEYWGMPQDWDAIVEKLVDMEMLGDLDGRMWQELRYGPWWRLSRHVYWAVWRVIGFLILPLIAIKIARLNVRDQNLRWKGTADHFWIYGLAFVVVLICVIGVSFTEGFSSYYPFYKLSHRSWFDFLFWELFYILQFLSLEFFFRGWWLRAGKTMMGSAAIFAMIPAYVMIHFGKEMPETLAAIFAGVFLGTLAMRTRSIWGGFMVHCLVAISMDVAALLQTDGLPTRWWPDF